MRRSTILLAALMAVPVLSGCISETFTDTGGHVLAENGSMSYGFAYDGQGVQSIGGYIWIDANEASNEGEVLVLANGSAMGVEVVMDRFAGTSDFHSGGIAAGFVEHGDSGVGDTSIPAVQLALAGWGLAKVHLGGTLLSDPIEGDDDWTAHFMVIENGVRDDESGAIFKASGNGSYDPAMPADGQSVEGDHEIHLVLKSGGDANASSAEPFTFTNSGAINSADYSNDHTFQGSPGSSVAMDFSVSSTAPLEQTTSLTFTVSSPSGQELHSETFGPGGEGSFEFDPQEAGEYTVAVSGQGAAASYEVAGEVTYRPVVIYLWWEDVLFGQAAIDRAEETGASTHEH